MINWYFFFEFLIIFRLHVLYANDIAAKHGADYYTLILE